MSVPVPQVSVVVGVRNGAEQILRTINSVLAQQGVCVECVVVDDGSSDTTADAVAALAVTDARVRLFRQRAAGLTQALITGCAEAKAELIARIDAGDEMHVNRLARQCAVLAERADIAVLGCLSIERGPGGQNLSAPQEQIGTVTDLTPGYARAEADAMIGPAHFSTCFRRQLYRRCGGYRAAFGLAQDVDLWSRMSALGKVARLEEALTVSRIAADALSTRHHRTQIQLREIAAASALRRLHGSTDDDLLREARCLSQRARAHGGSSGAAAYHIACRLAQSGQHERALPMFVRAARHAPWHARHWLRLGQACAHQAASSVRARLRGHSWATQNNTQALERAADE